MNTGTEKSELLYYFTENGKQGLINREKIDGIHKRVNAGDAVFEGSSGSGKAGTVSIANLSMAHTKGSTVSITLVGWDESGTNSVSVYNVPAVVTKRLYYNSNTGQVVGTRAEATGMKIYYRITQGVKFDWPGDRDGVLVSNREIRGILSF
ncbi:MAG: hypothetical protein WBB45_20195 [Cyclobacteriaceae bacterium]